MAVRQDDEWELSEYTRRYDNKRRWRALLAVVRGRFRCIVALAGGVGFSRQHNRYDRVKTEHGNFGYSLDGYAPPPFTFNSRNIIHRQRTYIRIQWSLYWLFLYFYAENIPLPPAHPVDVHRPCSRSCRRDTAHNIKKILYIVIIIVKGYFSKRKYYCHNEIRVYPWRDWITLTPW